PGAGELVILAGRERRCARLVAGPGVVHETATGREWTLPVSAFWQVHPHTAQVLADAVVELLEPHPGERAWDLYGGAGLFAAALAGAGVEVTLVEGDRAGAEAARTNLADLPAVRVVRASVERFRPPYPPDLVVLDPPRTGAGAGVVRTIAAAGPRAVA